MTTGPAGAQTSTVIGWGLNDDGQASPPPGLRDAVQVAPAFRYSLAVRADGTVVGWGTNPGVPSGLDGVAALATHGGRNQALRSNGTVVAWSTFEPDFAQKVPAGLSNVIAAVETGAYGLALKSDGTVVSWGNHTNVPPGLSNVISVAGAIDVRLAARSDGTVLAWGADGAVRSGFVPEGLSNVVAVAASSFDYCMALKSDGTVVTWGERSGGAVGPVPASLSNVVAISTYSLSPLALGAEGRVVAWGQNDSGQTNVPARATNVTAIATGFAHALAISGSTPAPWPRITAQPQSARRLAGDSITFSVAANAGAPLSYRWQSRGRDLPNQTNVSLVLNPLQLSDAGDYAVVVSAGGLAVRSAPAFLAVSHPPVAVAVTAEGIEDSDVVIGLEAFDPSDLPVLRKIVSLPSSGRLFQFDKGRRGPPIESVPAAVTADGVLIYAPASDGNGAPYDKFLFVAGNEIGDSAPAKVTIDIRPVNDPPVAQAGPDQTVECAGARTPVLLDGRGSSDVDDEGLEFAWLEGATLLGTNRILETNLSLGEHTILLTVRDPAGALSQDTVVVRIVDTAPPSIECPADLEVEFAGATGAVADFTLVATDACPVTLTCAPPSGSAFAIGRTLVQCSAVDQAGNRAACTFNVTVLGARAIRQRLLAELIALRAGVNDPMDADRLNDAVRHLNESLASVLWLDETHLVPHHGERVFHHDRAAADKLQQLARDKNGSVRAATLNEFIARLLRVDRLLALVSVDEARAAGANPKKVAEDRRELARGDDDAANGRPVQAIEHYANAWKHAVHLQVKAVARAGASGLAVRFVGFPGRAYAVEVSTNLIDWVPLDTATANAEGVIEFEDREAADVRARFLSRGRTRNGFLSQCGETAHRR